MYSLYKAAETPFNWHKPLFDYAKEIGITIFSSPFDETAVDLLENLTSLLAHLIKLEEDEVITKDGEEYIWNDAI